MDHPTGFFCYQAALEEEKKSRKIFKKARWKVKNI
jgi:hypothetical protein